MMWQGNDVPRMTFFVGHNFVSGLRTLKPIKSKKLKKLFPKT